MVPWWWPACCRGPLLGPARARAPLAAPAYPPCPARHHACFCDPPACLPACPCPGAGQDVGELRGLGLWAGACCGLPACCLPACLPHTSGPCLPPKCFSVLLPPTCLGAAQMLAMICFAWGVGISRWVGPKDDCIHREVTPAVSPGCRHCRVTSGRLAGPPVPPAPPCLPSHRHLSGLPTPSCAALSTTSTTCLMCWVGGRAGGHGLLHCTSLYCADPASPSRCCTI